MNGWIKLYRQLQDCPIWYGERFSKGQAWVDLLMLANHSDKKIMFNGEFITIQRGQYLTSMVKLSEKWKWNRKTVSSFLKLLENDNMITKVTDNTKTLITIVNYGIYQSENQNDGQPITQPNGQPIGQPFTQPTGQQRDNPTDNLLDTNKNDKNIKNDEERKECEEDKKEEKPKKKEPTVYYPNDELLDSAFKEFLIMRNKIKKPIATKQALTRMMNKIEKLSGGDNDLAIKILNQSTDHCWQDVYELKEGNRSCYSANTSFQNQSKQAKFERLMSRIKEDEKNANGGC